MVESKKSNTLIFPGTGDEALSLLAAFKHNCGCKMEGGRILATCPGHDMLAHDQRAVNGLVFERRDAARLLAEEFGRKGH